MKAQLIENRVAKRMALSGDKLGAGAFIKGNLLILGEQASHPDSDPEQKPFCSTKACSGWLNWELEKLGVPEEAMFWLNVLNNDGTPAPLLETISELQPTEVIALGNVAKMACKKLGVEHLGFSHPQYWKRFRSKESYPFIKYLEVKLGSKISKMKEVS